MLIALLADIHANRQAFEACLAHASTRNVDRYVLLGDYVGYGGDPAWTVETIMGMVTNGALAVQGNHDVTISRDDDHLHADARFVVEWTRNQLGVAERKFLADLPLTIEDEDRLYVHADAYAPERWNYITTVEDAHRNLTTTPSRVIFVGHVHQPAIYGLSATAKMTSFTPVGNVPVPLLGWRRWLVVLGSVGQPRDSDPSACYATFDTQKGEIIFHRVAYDIEGAAAAIRANGLPVWLAERLFRGK